MIFGFLVKAIKFLVDGFASVCAFLLVTLGLWLPAVYSLLFLIICAIAGIKLQGGVITLYIIGLVLTFAGAVAISVFRYNRKKKKNKKPSRRAQTNVRSVKKSEYAGGKNKAADYCYDDGYYPQDDSYADNSYANVQPTQESVTSEPRTSESMTPESVTFGQAYAPPSEEKENIVSKAKNELYSQNKDYKYDDFSDLRKKYFGDENAKDETPTAPSANNMPAGDNNPNKNSYGDILSQSGFSTQRESEGYLSSRSPDALSREHLERRLMGCETEEKPMVFASRRDPNIIIYEYSDRLKFYKKTKRGLIHVSTEFKQ